jgi:predicted enzyme related to lactoylglutathione lyase
MSQTTPVIQNAINWFEIPVTQLDRAQQFYETLLQAPLRREVMGPQTLAVLPYNPESGVGGALLLSATARAPGSGGVLVYLNAGRQLAPALTRLAEAGGRIVTPRVDLPDGMGAFVHFEDSEGNVLGLHAEA